MGMSQMGKRGQGGEGGSRKGRVEKKSGKGAGRIDTR